MSTSVHAANQVGPSTVHVRNGGDQSVPRLREPHLRPTVTPRGYARIYVDQRCELSKSMVLYSSVSGNVFCLIRPPLALLSSEKDKRGAEEDNRHMAPASSHLWCRFRGGITRAKARRPLRLTTTVGLDRIEEVQSGMYDMMFAVAMCPCVPRSSRKSPKC
jgi:hypothetical protein